MPTLIHKPIVQMMENSSKVLAPNSSKVQDTVVPIPIPSYTIPQMKSMDNTSSRKTIQDASREIAIYPEPFY